MTFVNLILIAKTGFIRAAKGISGRDKGILYPLLFPLRRFPKTTTFLNIGDDLLPFLCWDLPRWAEF